MTVSFKIYAPPAGFRVHGSVGWMKQYREIWLPFLTDPYRLFARTNRLSLGSISMPLTATECSIN